MAIHNYLSLVHGTGRARDEIMVPARLAQRLILNGDAPPRMQVAGVLDLSYQPALTHLPTGLTADSIDLTGCTGLRALPEGLRVSYRLDLTGCAALEVLPRGLQVGTLILRQCTALTALPEDLDVYFLDLTGCTALRWWPRRASVRFGRLIARGCTGLRDLPPWLTHLAQLDVSDCPHLTALPPWLHVSSWIDIGGTGITTIPDTLGNAQIRRYGRPVR